MEPGLITHAEIIRVIDGDTIRVRVTREFNVRIRGVDAPEKDTLEGQKAKDYVANFTHWDCLVFIPANKETEFLDFNSFNRVVADVYIDLGETSSDFHSLANMLKANGFIKHV